MSLKLNEFQASLGEDRFYTDGNINDEDNFKDLERINFNKNFSAS